MASTFPDSDSITRLTEGVAGDVRLPGDEGYRDASTIWNHRLQRYPGLVVSCANAEDVQRAVEFATEFDLAIAVRGGGHDYAGKGAIEDGLLFDLSPMNRVEVDPDAATAVVGAGATWGDMDAATQEHGLAVPGPTVSSVGVGGSTLGGGQGHFSRKYGLAIDNVRAFDLVTADGDRVTASEDDQADLFWALRGGLGNFGIVTRFTFDLHPIGPDVLGGQAMHRFDDAREVLEFYREYVEDLPDAAMCYAFVLPVPPVEGIPEAEHGAPAISLIFAYDGPRDRGEALVRPLREFGDPFVVDFDWMPYTVLQQMFDEAMPDGLRWYSRSLDLDTISDDVIETVLEYGSELSGAFTSAYFVPMSGEINRVDAEDTAFPGREADFSVHILAGWESAADDEPVRAWTRAFHNALDEHATDGVYVNLLGEDEGARVPEAYGENWERLRELKGTWDPEDRLRATHHIPPQ